MYELISKENDLLEKLLNSRQDKKLIDRMKYLGQLNFWCDDIEEGDCCFNHVIGLPKHPATGIENPLTPYQNECFKKINVNRYPTEGISEEEWKKRSHKYHVNKGRQMGFTEFFLRIIYYYVCNRYWGRAVGIIAGTNGRLARKNLKRFKRLGRDLKKIIINQTTTAVTFANGCVVEAFPATEESMTGDTKYACIMMDEAAKWKNIDDEPVFNSILPIIETNGSDLFLISTPKGPIKMFYKIWKEPDDYQKLEYNIWAAEGNLYSHDKIQSMIKNFKGDANQEFLCKFSVGEDSIFGFVEDADRGTHTEWDVDDEIVWEHNNHEEKKQSDEEWISPSVEGIQYI